MLSPSRVSTHSDFAQGDNDSRKSSLVLDRADSLNAWRAPWRLLRLAWNGDGVFARRSGKGYPKQRNSPAKYRETAPADGS